MLEITTKKRRWPHVVITFVVLLVLAVGGYVIITIMSPDIPVLSDRPQNATVEKLTKPASSDNRLYLPQINIDLPIVTGHDSSALERGAWHKTPENGDPETEGNFALSAYRFVVGMTPQQTVGKSPFYNLAQLAKGDQVYVDYNGKRYKYEISKTSGISVKDVEAGSDDAVLTLYARTAEGDVDGRTIVQAKLMGQADTQQLEE